MNEMDMLTHAFMSRDIKRRSEMQGKGEAKRSV